MWPRRGGRRCQGSALRCGLFETALWAALDDAWSVAVQAWRRTFRRRCDGSTEFVFVEDGQVLGDDVG